MTDYSGLFPKRENPRLKRYKARKHQLSCMCQPCQEDRRILLDAGLWAPVYDVNTNGGESRQS